jgi:hypothetical protein
VALVALLALYRQTLVARVVQVVQSPLQILLAHKLEIRSSLVVRVVFQPRVWVQQLALQVVPVVQSPLQILLVR